MYVWLFSLYHKNKGDNYSLIYISGLETQRVETVLPHETPDLFIPLILYPIKDTTVYKGQEAYFECAVDKQPNLTVKWYKDGKEIRQKKRKYSFKVGTFGNMQC